MQTYPYRPCRLQSLFYLCLFRDQRFWSSSSLQSNQKKEFKTVNGSKDLRVKNLTESTKPLLTPRSPTDAFAHVSMCSRCDCFLTCPCTTGIHTFSKMNSPTSFQTSHTHLAIKDSYKLTFSSQSNARCAILQLGLRSQNLKSHEPNTLAACKLYIHMQFNEMQSNTLTAHFHTKAQGLAKDADSRCKP